MPTPPTVERRPEDELVEDQDAISFRGATLEEAVALAEQSLGPRIRVVAANRIRRGGIGGFFASDLGVEVSVVPENETMDEALERLVAESEEQDRSHWQVERETRPCTSAMATPTTMAPPADSAVAPVPVPEPVPQRISEPSFYEPHITVPRFAASAFAEPNPQPRTVSDRPAPVPVERLSAPEVVRRRATPAPSRRQVELAVAAADQLIERLSLTPRVKRLSVKVVVRAGDHREVETEATWEAQP